MKSRKQIVGLCAIFICSLGLVVLFHYEIPTNFAGELASIPAIGALFFALFQLGRDTIANERAIRNEEAKNRFVIGATSHMANVAFDKHVLFCEEYTKAINAALVVLIRRGPCQEALDEAGKLLGIRKEWSLWSTTHIDNELEKFEKALRIIGANAMATEMTGAAPPGSIDESYRTFAGIIGLDSWQGGEVDREIAAAKMIEKLRGILGIATLTNLRTTLIENASEN